MRSSLMLPILLLFVIFMSTHQALNPICQPVSSSETYEKTLFVFVVESDLTPVGIKYVMKQMACAIPESANLKSYILDYSDEAVALSNTDNDFSTSQQFVGKIASSLTGQPTATDKCERMKKVYDKFAQQAIVQGFTKVKYIAIYMTTVCPSPTDATSWFDFPIKYENRQFWYMENTRHADLFSTTETDAPQFLIDLSRKVIGISIDENGEENLSDSKIEWTQPRKICTKENDYDIVFIVIGFFLCSGCYFGGFLVGLYIKNRRQN